MGDDGGGDAACENPPKLYPNSGLYCPFSGVDGGSSVTCAAGQHCCEVPSGSTTPSTCEAAGTACPVANSVDWQCEEPSDCTAADAGGSVCCVAATPMTVTSCGNSWTEWTGLTGTKCMTSCPSGSYVVCMQNSDCTGDAGATCHISKSNGNDFGYCGP